MQSLSLSHSWRLISSLGLSASENLQEKRSLILNNQISFSVFLLLVILIVSFRITIPNNHIIVYWLMGLTLALGASLYLNSLGSFKLNQLILSSGMSIVLIGATIHSKLHHPDLIHEGSYYNPRYFLIGLAFMPYMVFEPKSIYLWLSIAINLGFIIFYNQIHDWFGADPMSIMNVEVLSYSFISIASSSAGVAVVISMYFMKNTNFNHETRIESLLTETRLKKEEIDSSIRYASYLQESIINSGPGILELSPSSSCLNLPHDVVSGDFFVNRSLGKQQLIAAADCTGHGVPGAFVSLLAFKSVSSALEQGYIEPAELLSTVNSSLHADFNSSTYSALKDGMDIGICLINPEEKTITYSNAKSYIYVLRNDGVERLNSERQSIGDVSNHPFKSWTTSYQTGDVLLLTSDGYTDQFGGPNNKKFGRRQFEEMILEHKGLRHQSLVRVIQERLVAWKGLAEQTDDICVLVHQL